MKTKNSKPRSMRISVDTADVTCSWKSSSITLLEYNDGNIVKRVIVEIDSPYAVSYIREQLDKIVAGWQSDLRIVAAAPQA